MQQEQHEQLRMVARSAADFAAAHGGPARARAIHAAGARPDMAAWQAMAQLGWLGIAVPESAGGLALGAAAACVVAEECGRALHMQPLNAALAAAGLLAAAQEAGGDAAVQALALLLAGAGPVVCAEAAGTAAEPVLSLVPDGDAANRWLVAQGQGAGFALRLLHTDRPGVQLSVRAAVDGSHLVDASVQRAAWADADRLLQGEAGQAAWLRARALAWLGDAAYLCGLAHAALQLAVDYMGMRRQFGAPIGSFQALQHRAADCHVDLTASRALVHEAARAWDGGQGDWAAAAAVHRAAQSALRVAQEGVQFHGAIGFADEHDAGLYLRRAMAVGARHQAAAHARLRQGRAGAPGR